MKKKPTDQPFWGGSCNHKHKKKFGLTKCTQDFLGNHGISGGTPWYHIEHSANN